MTTSSKEILSWAKETATEIIWKTKQSLSILEKETWIKFFENASNRIKKLFWFKLNNETLSSTTITTQESKEISEKWWDKISDEMFQQLLKMEWTQDFIAKSHKKKFWENFVTWPYGMVYKHIDTQGNLLKKPTQFKEWEKVTQERAKKNAKACYDKRAKEWKDSLDAKGYIYNQDMLDSLVSTCWWTSKARKSLKDYVLSHRNNKNEVVNFISKHATTAAGNGKTMPGLVRRRKFEANWFIWNKKPYETYKA